MPDRRSDLSQPRLVRADLDAALESMYERLRLDASITVAAPPARFWDRWGSLVIYIASTVLAILFAYNQTQVEVAVLKNEVYNLRAAVSQLSDDVRRIKP